MVGVVDFFMIYNLYFLSSARFDDSNGSVLVEIIYNFVDPDIELNHAPHLLIERPEEIVTNATWEVKIVQGAKKMATKQQLNVFTQQGFLTVFDATVKHAGGPHMHPFPRLHIHMDPVADSPHAEKRKADHVAFTTQLPDVSRTAILNRQSNAKIHQQIGGIDRPLIFTGFHSH